LARQLGVDPADGYALIAALGGDCPGAVTFIPAGEPVASPARDSIAWLSERELAELVSPQERHSPRRPPPRLRATLGGERHKLSLVRRGVDGPWARPEPGLPGTHVVKPETGDLPELAVNEMFCMAVLRQAGLPAAKTSLQTIGGRPCLVSPRFDLSWEGEVGRRIHQETFCQALGIAPDAAAGSAEATAPGFAEASGLLRAVGREADVPTLVQAAFANYILGNGDTRGSNFALLFRDDGIRLAPLYDVASTVVYGEPPRGGMSLPGDYDPAACLRGLGQVADECGIELEIFHIQATCALQGACNAIEVVAEWAEEDGWHAPVIDRIYDLAQNRASHCAETLSLWDHFDT